MKKVEWVITEVEWVIIAKVEWVITEVGWIINGKVEWEMNEVEWVIKKAVEWVMEWVKKKPTLIHESIGADFRNAFDFI